MNKIFAGGIMFQLPSDKAPDWVVGKISINTVKFINFLQHHQNDRGWINLDIKIAKSGITYVELNTFQPDKEKSQEGGNLAQQGEENEAVTLPQIDENEIPIVQDEINIKDIPF